MNDHRSAKELRVAPISSASARAVVKAYHYSGKSVNNSQINLGVFLEGKCMGVMQFGPPLDRRRLLAMVPGAKWNSIIELNRMAFGDSLPRNSESRALAVAFRIFKTSYPEIETVVSFADATQCGDGTIYRASGFLLTQIRKNDQIWITPKGNTYARISFTNAKTSGIREKLIAEIEDEFPEIVKEIERSGGVRLEHVRACGWKPLDGYQIRYVKFLTEEARARYNGRVLPFTALDDYKARMYKGESIKPTRRVTRRTSP